MASNFANGTPQSTFTELAAGIIDDAQRLLRQEVELARREMQAEWEKAKVAGVSLGIGTGMTAAGGFFLSFALIYLIAYLTKWDLSACFGLVGGLLTLVGAVLVIRGGKKASEVNLVPERAVAELRETVAETSEKVSETVAETENRVASAVRHTTEAIQEVTGGTSTR
jgi:hypothetical protein